MTLLYLSIPFMLIGIAMAVAPLLWAMTNRERLREAAIPAEVPQDVALLSEHPGRGPREP
jgi:hypothetical protein